MKKDLLVSITAMLAILVSLHSDQARAGDRASSEAKGQPVVAAPAYADQVGFRDIVKSATRKVFPAVIYIKCLREGHESGRKVTGEVSGSGVLISPDGEALTNWHVVNKAASVRCLLADGRHFRAEVVGKDKDLDLALIKLKVPEGKKLPAARLGDSDALTEGDFAMAMGAPWGLSRSVSIGIIACTRRFLEDQSEYSLWLQTDAAICPGNSGGPLVNTAGRIIGLNTLGIMYGGDLGFAIPSNTIRDVLPSLREHGSIQRSWSGLQLQALNDFDRNVYFEATEGVIVAGAEPGSPAEQAGLLARDRIVSLGGKEVTARTAEDLPAIRRALAWLEVDKPTPLVVFRDGNRIELQLTCRNKGAVEGKEFDCPRWDLTLKEINQFENPQLHFHRKKGIFIFGVEGTGNAMAAGLHEHDIVVKIDDKNIETLDEAQAVYEEAVKKVETQPRILMTILRNGMRRQIVLDFSRDYQRD
jgi:serine protease Do